MYDLDLADYSRSIGGHEESAQVIDDEFISTYRCCQRPFCYPREENDAYHWAQNLS